MSDSKGAFKIGRDSAHYPPGLVNKVCDLVVNSLVTTGAPAMFPEGIHWKWEDPEQLRRLLTKDPAEQWCSAHVQATGPPILVCNGVKWRSFADGGGLSSPGRWLPHHRGPPK